MTLEEQLNISLTYINEILKLTVDNPHTIYIKSHLIPVKYELQRQQQKLINLDSNYTVSAE